MWTTLMARSVVRSGLAGNSGTVSVINVPPVAFLVRWPGLTHIQPSSTCMRGGERVLLLMHTTHTHTHPYK